MDLSKYTVEELKQIRNKLEKDVVDLKRELEIVENAVQNPHPENITKLNKVRPSSSSQADVSTSKQGDDGTSIEFLTAITKININDMTVKPIANNENETYFLYRVKANIGKIIFEVEYQSNLDQKKCLSHNVKEDIKTLNIKIVQPMLQDKVQSGITFFSENPTCFGGAMLFLLKLSTLYDIRTNIVKKLHIEYKKSILVSVSKSTDQYCITFKSEVNEKQYLHIKWFLRWESRICSARDLFTAKIIFADDELLAIVQPLIDKLCSDKFSLDCEENDKYGIFHKLCIAVKNTDTKNCNSSNATDKASGETRKQ